MSDPETYHFGKNRSAVTKLYLAKLAKAYRRSVALDRKSRHTQYGPLACKKVHIPQCSVKPLEVYRCLVGTAFFH
jgi:hypothetical protein